MSPYMRRQLVDVVFALVPIVALAILTKPALRQAIAMKALHMSKEFCQMNADFWQQLATTSAQAYNNARL